MVLKLCGIILGLSVFLTACTNVEKSTPPAVSLENFTTEGNPTKTVQTPWGDKQVYDPVQDPEVIAAFNYVKHMHKRYGYDKKYNELKRYDSFFEAIRETQYLDMGRLGCQDIKRPVCNNDFNNFIRNTIRQNCPNASFGTRKLNACEAAHSKMQTEYEYELTPLGDTNKPILCEWSVFSTIGSKTRAELLGVREDNVSEFFDLTCRSYEGRLEDGDLVRVPQ